MKNDLENQIDMLVFDYEMDPLEAILFILEQYLLEDGIKGQDAYQDLLGSAWKDLRKADTLTKGKV